MLRQDHSAVSRAVSLVENQAPEAGVLLAALGPHLGRAHRIGITGPPGAGKSTLTRALVEVWRRQGHSVAVVAVDPSSPVTGGALLGDRIRMEPVALDDSVFIRSMATRGASGGLAHTTAQVCDVLDAAGYQRIVIETVGVGQSEIAIIGVAQTTVLVLVPESGDGIQMLKAGVMEVADLFVINKADRPGAARLARDLELSQRIRTVAASSTGWSPPVLSTVAIAGTGVEALAEAIASHRASLG
ncbi:MAG: methylmalonyl Co-A mutase-associated GTPase MeaB [Gemmatimonadota bacterium]